MYKLKRIENLLDVAMWKVAFKCFKVEIGHGDDVFDPCRLRLALLEAVIKFPEFNYVRTTTLVRDVKRLAHCNDVQIFVGDEFLAWRHNVGKFRFWDRIFTGDVERLIGDVGMLQHPRKIAQNLAQTCRLI